MPRSLADGHTKVTILTEEPPNPAAPTITVLNAGIQASARILTSDFNWGATDSEKIAEKALADLNNSNAIGAGNYTAGFTVWRFYDADDLTPDPVGDEVYEALKEKGTEVWIYARETAKLATAAWAAGDEIFLGGRVLTDTPQPPSDRGGFIKRRIPMEMQTAYDNIVAAAGA